MDQVPEVGVTELVALINQTFEFAYPSMDIIGELANLRVSKNKWVYFDLKDQTSTVKFFGTVYHLPGPLEEGMMLRVRGTPRLHNLYGFSINVIKIQPSGEGSIKKAAELLRQQLTKEGLFEQSRKRQLPYSPARVGLITSEQSAAYADFIKIIGQRWREIRIELLDVQVQGEIAPAQIASAIEQFNSAAETNDVLVIIRGGGSAEDLAAYNSEIVTRAVAASRIPTLVAIGHEIDLSLAELAADRRASTPSNAAEILVPDEKQVRAKLLSFNAHLNSFGRSVFIETRTRIRQATQDLNQILASRILSLKNANQTNAKILSALNPESALQRGFSIVSFNGKAITSTRQIKSGNMVDIRVYDGSFEASVETIKEGKDG